MGFNLIYWNPMRGSYILYGSILEKCGNFRKNGHFSGRIWPDWGNTTWADMAGLGSIGLSVAWALPSMRKAALFSPRIRLLFAESVNNQLFV